MEVTDVIKCIFSVFPHAKLVGKYIIFQFQGRPKEDFDQIDIVNPCQLPMHDIQIFQGLLGDYLTDMEEYTEFEGLTPFQYRMTLQNINDKEIFKLNISVDYGTQCHLTIGNIGINNEGNIILRTFYNYGYSMEDNIRDILNKTITFAIPINSVFNSVERKYSYLRIINLMSDLIEIDGPNIWNFKSNSESNILNIFKHVDNMDITENPHDTEFVCPICRDDFSSGDMCIKLTCSHKFHTICLTSNLSGLGPNSDTCPICRHQII